MPDPNRTAAEPVRESFGDAFPRFTAEPFSAPGPGIAEHAQAAGLIWQWTPESAATYWLAASINNLADAIRQLAAK